MDHKYRSIRPRDNGGKSNPLQTEQPRKRRLKTTACNPCKNKKIRCDRARPICSACVDSSVTCVYDEGESPNERRLRIEGENDNLKLELNNVKEALELLKTVPGDRAVDLLKHIRNAAEPIKALNLMANGLQLNQHLSEHKAARSILPAVQSGLEFELMVTHPISYPTLLPMLLSKTDADQLLSPPNPHSESIFDANHSLSPRNTIRNTRSGKTSSLNRWQRAYSSSILSSQASNRSTQTIGAFGPQTAPEYFDERLRQLKIDHWSRVAIQNDAAAHLISLFLEIDHPVLGLFDAELFITDLIEWKDRFCSPLLVSAVLFWAEGCYGSIVSAAVSLETEFLHEANELLNSTQNRGSLDCIAAVHLLSLGCLGRGEERLGMGFVDQSAKFDQFETLVSDEIEQMPFEWQRATTQTTWANFNLLMMRSVIYRRGVPRTIPKCSIPGEDVYDEESAGSALYGCYTFRTFCQFWAIVHELAIVYYDESETPIGDRVTLELAESSYQKLLHWADGLRASVSRGEHKPHHVVDFHSFYHSMIMDIFHPYISTTSELKTFTSLESTPKAVYAASLNQLKRIVILHRLHSPLATYSTWWHTALTHVANGVLTDNTDPEWQFYLLVCIYGYQRLFRLHRIVRGILAGILSMALEKGHMDVPEARARLSELERHGKRHGQVDIVEGTWILDFERALHDQTAGQMDNAASRFEELSMLDEFISEI